MDGRASRSASKEWSRWAEPVERWWRGARTERDLLPWRSERDPWRVLVSEVMLAQTQASRVAQRYPEVIAALATPQDAAAMSVAEIVSLWHGLGYYRRALALRDTAQVVVRDFDGVLPSDLAGLLRLPGVGQYTARAVLAFAHGHGVGVLDTNIGRVLARAIAGEPLVPRAAQSLADRLVVGRNAREWNLALMDLGATLCVARGPLCVACPLREASACAWQREGGEDPAPRSAGTTRPQARFLGSDRQGRGQLLKAALDGPIAARDLAGAAGWPDDEERARRVASQLASEGLLEHLSRGAFGLPGRPGGHAASGQR